MRFRITINRDRLDNSNDPKVIRIEDLRTNEISHHEEVMLFPKGDQYPIIKYGPAQADGARVWIEAELVEVDNA